jgi:hypothetical protein
MNNKLYVVTRSDLPLGDQAVQAGHAVAKYLLEFIPRKAKNPLWENETLVYLVVEDLQHFDMLIRRLRSQFYQFVIWFEPDLNGELTALACHTYCPAFDSLKMLGK